MSILDYFQVALGGAAVLAGVALLQAVVLWPLGNQSARRLTWRMFGHPSDPRWRELGHYRSVFGTCVKLMRPAAIACAVTWPLVLVLAIVAD